MHDPIISLKCKPWKHQHRKHKFLGLKCNPWPPEYEEEPNCDVWHVLVRHVKNIRGCVLTVYLGMHKRIRTKLKCVQLSVGQDIPGTIWYYCSLAFTPFIEVQQKMVLKPAVNLALINKKNYPHTIHHTRARFNLQAALRASELTQTYRSIAAS